MLYLLESDTRNVKWNGIPLHEATSAVIKEQMNGDFILTVRYPITDSEIYQLFREDMLIKAPAPVIGSQLFRIKKPVENDDHLEITAYHITDDVMQRSINPLSVNKQSCWQALSQLVQVAKSPINDFSFTSDITDRRTINTKEVETLYSVLMDGAHSIVGTWEGELVRDNFAISIKRNRGEDRGVIISTHKNLKSYQRTKNSQNVVTRIHAKSTFKAEGAKEDTTISITVDSPLIGAYPYINERSYTNNNIQTVEELTKWASAKFTNEHIDKATDAIKIEAYELDGQTVHMGDTVNLKSYKHNVDVYKKAIAYEYDCLANNGQGAYLTITFDDKVKSGGNGGGVSAVANAILDKQETKFDIMLERAIANADRAFDAEFAKREKDITDGIELAKAKAEEVKQELSDTINQRFDSFDNGPLKEAKRKAEEALKNAGASSLLAQEAKQIGLDSVARLEAFKSQATSAQSALSGDLGALKQTVTSEVNQASEYRRTTTEALSRMTGQMNGFATKSEVKQGIDGLTQTFAKMKVGGRNYAEDYDFSRGLWRYHQGDNSPRDWTISNGEYNVKGTTNTWKQMQIFSKEGSRVSEKDSTALLDLEIGETYTLSFQAMCHSGNPRVWVSLRANRTVPGNPEIISGNFNLTSSWQTYQVTIPALTKPDNFDFWRIILGYNEIGHVAFRKVELTRSSTRIDAGPAPEDGKTDLIAAKSTFERTAQGLRTDLSAIKEYVNKDGQRQEALQRYTREESAKQATAVRELVNSDFVGKSTYQEDVRGLERRFEAITNPQNGSIAAQIANYKKSVDGRFADISSLLSGKANQSDFQRVKETSQLYERILGNTENGIADKVARMALTSQLFQVEVSKASASGRNLFLNSLFKRDLRDKYSTYKLFDDASQTKGQLAVSIDSDNQFRGVNTLKIVSTFNGKTDNQKITFSLGGNSRTGRVDELKNKSARFSFWAKSTVNNTNFQARAGYRGAVKSVSLTTDWQFYDVEFIRNENTNATSELILHVFSNATVWIAFPKVEIGTVSTPFSEAPEDTDEAIRSVQTQLAGSWAVQNLTSAGALVSGLNLGANGHNRLDGKLTHITGETLIDRAVIKSAMVDKLKTANFEAGSVTTVVLDAEAVTAEKVKFDNAFIRKMIANEAFIEQLTSKRIFATKVESVITSSTVLEGYKGWIGGFQLGTHDSGSGRWLTGRNHFSVGMGDGEGGSGQTALWVNWGGNWSEPGYYAWFVKNNGKMYCYNTAEFWKTPIIHGDLKVTGRIRYDGGVWIYSGEYEKIGRSSKDYFYLEKASGARDWFPAWNDTSDRRLKSNIQESSVSGVDVINRLKTYSYRKEFNNEVEDISCGIMAQDVQKYAPDAFREGPDGVYTYNTFALVPYLIKAIQELNQKIEKMEKTIA